MADMTTPMKLMKNQQSGFTLVEIAIVLVIIGLLLGGILKGQELINSAKVKNLAQDFKTVPLYIYGYQDRFKALPGDDKNAVTNITGATLAGGGNTGNGVIDGDWQSETTTDESFLFWQHVRLGGFAPGATTFGTPADLAAYLPKNVEGNRMGITGGANMPINTLRGTFVFCSSGLLGKYAKQLDATLDDGKTDSGSVMVRANSAPGGASTAPLTNAQVDDALSYTVCMGF